MFGSVFKDKSIIKWFIGTFIFVDILALVAFAQSDVVYGPNDFWTVLNNILYWPGTTLLGSSFASPSQVFINALLINPLLWSILITVLLLVMGKSTKK